MFFVFLQFRSKILLDAIGSTCVHLTIDDFDDTLFSRFGQPIWVSSFYRFESMKKT